MELRQPGRSSRKIEQKQKDQSRIDFGQGLRKRRIGIAEPAGASCHREITPIKLNIPKISRNIEQFQQRRCLSA